MRNRTGIPVVLALTGAMLAATLASAPAAYAGDEPSRPAGEPDSSSHPAPSGGPKALSAVRAVARGRYYEPPAGFVPVASLPPEFSARVRSISLDRRGAFEGTAAVTQLERDGYALLGNLHVLTRKSTLRQRLLFAESSLVTQELLAETERSLRSQEFLSDAYLAASPIADGACDIVITTFDQWTTVPGAGVAVHNFNFGNVYHGNWSRIWDDEWYWWVGLLEANLAGTGTRAGLFARRDPERTSRELLVSNGNLTRLRLKANLDLAWLSDGDSLRLDLSKPLESRSDRHAYGVHLFSQELSERWYFDANRLDTLPSGVAQDAAGRDHTLRVFRRMDTHEAEIWYTRSFGSALKFNAGPFLRYRERYHAGGTGGPDSTLLGHAEAPADLGEPRQRLDVVPGIALALYQYRLHTSRNFRNLKWSENVESGWRVNAEAGKDQQWLGARAADWKLGGEALGSGFWDDRFWLYGSGAWNAFVRENGSLADGRVDARGEAAIRESRLTSSWLTASWANLVGAAETDQLTLGDVDGLSGYASHAFAGQARVLLSAEQRFFPDWEWLTMVPAFAAFANAGNTFPAWRDADLSALHGSLGFGLRLGRSKSTQKVVQHINVNFPVGEDFLPGAVITVLAKKTL